tara:strand:+ start:2725 stop:2985 length:261 start_codon:yes stop_codon:yes gene_type:complete
MDKEINVIDTIIKLMEQVEQMVDKTGEEKKHIVMAGSKLVLGEDVYERYIYFISMFIDFAINISKGDIKLNLNNIKKKCIKFPCCF